MNMNKSQILLGLTFVAGFSLAMFLNSSDIISKETQDAKNSNNIYKKDVYTNTDNEQVVKLNHKNEEQTTDNITKTSESEKAQPEYNNESEENLSPAEVLIKYPPPHIADANFFKSPDMNDQELREIRQKALDEHVQSMQEAGIASEDIQATIDAFKLEMEDTSKDGLSGNDEQPVLSQEQNDTDFSQSMLEAGESQESIQQMLKDLKTGNDEDNHTGIINGVANSDTGLDHMEPSHIE